LGGNFNAAQLTNDFIFVLINGGATPGNITGTFAQDSTITDSANDQFTILYNVDASGNAGAGSDVDLQLTSVGVVPEPGTWAILLSGMGMLIVFNRGRFAKKF
jgi:hypothetical protein